MTGASTQRQPVIPTPIPSLPQRPSQRSSCQLGEPFCELGAGPPDPSDDNKFSLSTSHGVSLALGSSWETYLSAASISSAYRLSFILISSRIRYPAVGF